MTPNWFIARSLRQVSRPSSVRHDHVRMELQLYLAAWHASHPEAAAEFIENG